MENLLTAQNILVLILVSAAGYYLYLKLFVFNKIKSVQKELTILFKKTASENEIEFVRFELEKKFKTDFSTIQQKDSRYALLAVKGPVPTPPPPPVIHPDYVKKLFIFYNRLPINYQNKISGFEIDSKFSF